jgi:hypothetical protein
MLLYKSFNLNTTTNLSLNGYMTVVFHRNTGEMLKGNNFLEGFRLINSQRFYYDIHKYMVRFLQYLHENG